MKWTWVHDACWAGDPLEVAHLLIEGADPNQVAPTTWRQTPLGRTLEFRLTHPEHAGYVDVVRLLLAHGADSVARSTPLDMTPYELACFCGLAGAAELLRPFQKRAPAIDYFARNGWDVNGRDADGHTALQKAAFLRYRRAIRTLLALGAKGTPLVP